MLSGFFNSGLKGT